MTKKQIMTSRRRNLSESDAKVSDDENQHLAHSPSLENTNNVGYFALSGLSSVDCFVSLPNDQVIKVEIESKATGNDVLNKICFNIGIIQEKEYFGLLYRGKSNEILWLNLRNRLSRQVTQNTPYRLDLRVKYFAQPHMIIGDECRHLFFLHAKHQVIDGCWIHGVSDSDLYHMIALIVQAEFGNFSHQTSCMKYAMLWPKILQEEITNSALLEIARYHETLKDLTTVKIEYEVLRMMSDSWVLYGTYFYDALDCLNKVIKLGIGPEGIYICSEKFALNEKCIYDAVEEVNYTDRVVELRLLQDDASIKSEKYCLKTAKLAKSFQRFVTETNQFFMLDTVESNILENAKTNTSFFKRSSSVKSYLYDVIKTSKEVYDNARRRAHSVSSICSPSVGDGHNDNVHTKSDSNQTSEEEVEELKRELENLRELVQCVVCRDRKINRVFIPCMHIVCCELCANRLTQCPVCRKYIRMSHHAYPKWIDDVQQQRQQLCPLPENDILTEIDVFDNQSPQIEHFQNRNNNALQSNPTESPYY